jgi:6-phosphofructokinase
MKHINFVTADDMPLVQMVVVTINGTRYGLVGPVVHVPGTMDQDLDVSEIEFGEIMPAHAAARMLEGRFKQIMGSEVQ